jgi:hypothetical protein
VLHAADVEVHAADITGRPRAQPVRLQLRVDPRSSSTVVHSVARDSGGSGEESASSSAKVFGE